MTAPQSLFKNYDMLISCGTGGVGKTTCAVAMGIAAAEQGRRALVLTIDPARRLANALGLKELTADIQNIDVPTSGSAPLSISMLDTKATFDHVITHYAKNPEQAQFLLNHPLYQQMSLLVMGSQEYMAMERLFELIESGDYDCIILDTPPSQHAIDFFLAPERLHHAINDSMLRLLIKPATKFGGFGAKIFAMGTEFLLNSFGKVAGIELLHEVSEFLISMTSFFDGFSKRAQAIHDALRNERTGVVLITAPEPQRINDAISFIDTLEEYNMNLVGIFCNGMWPTFEAGKNDGSVTSPALTKVLRENLEYCTTKYQQQQTLVQPLQKSCPANTRYQELTQHALPLTQIENLVALAGEITK